MPTVYPGLFGKLLSLAIVLAANVTQADATLPDGARALDTQEISRTFADVRDDAEVQDAAGTRAVNSWYADGRFHNRWRNERAQGEVIGLWRAHDNQRCITITDGLPERQGLEQCSPVYEYEGRYFSVEPDGTVHGIHRLSPLHDMADAPNIH